jgi:hypothetical protein
MFGLFVFLTFSGNKNAQVFKLCYEIGGHISSDVLINVALEHLKSNPSLQFAEFFCEIFKEFNKNKSPLDEAKCMEFIQFLINNVKIIEAFMDADEDGTSHNKHIH